MAVNLPNANIFLGSIGNHVVALRVAIESLQNDAAYINAMGGAAFLEAAPFSLSTADATFIANNIGAVTPSNSVVQAIDSFLATVVTLTAGQ